MAGCDLRYAWVSRRCVERHHELRIGAVIECLNREGAQAGCTLRLVTDETVLLSYSLASERRMLAARVGRSLVLRA